MDCSFRVRNVVLCIQVEGSLAAVVWFTGGERTRCSGKAAAGARRQPLVLVRPPMCRSVRAGGAKTEMERWRLVSRCATCALGLTELTLLAAAAQLT